MFLCKKIQKEEIIVENNNILKEKDVFAFMLNNNLKELIINLRTNTIEVTGSNGDKYFIIENFSLNDFSNIVLRIKDRMYMDLSKKQTKEIYYCRIKFDQYEYKDPFGFFMDDDIAILSAYGK